MTDQMARILKGRLRTASIPHNVLCELKKELRDYNMHTGTWRTDQCFVERS